MSLTDESNTEFTNVSQSNFNRVHNTVSKVGYTDGITDGRESVFQKGFDCGYENGLLTGFELAKYKAFFAVLNGKPTSDEIQAESAVYKDLNIPDAKDRLHFKMLDQSADNQNKVSEEQVSYVNQRKGVFANELPIVTSLFCQ